jgi:hypothetical protein
MACSDFPLDIYSAKKYGIEKWRKDYFWPVPYDSFSAHFDERNRLIINEKELIRALCREPTEPDTEFIERYMLPEGVRRDRTTDVKTIQDETNNNTA